jgi:hypothetical protein
MRLALLCALLGSLLGLTSCSHYRLGHEGTLRFRTLHVSIVANDALVPQARALVTTEVREAFIKDGRVRLVDTPDSADATLLLTLDNYARAMTVARADDTGLARRFEVTLGARARLIDNQTKQDLFTARPLRAKRGVFTDSGQLQSEYQGLPLLASDLANQVVKATLDTW